MSTLGEDFANIDLTVLAADANSIYDFMNAVRQAYPGYEYVLHNDSFDVMVRMYDVGNRRVYTQYTFSLSRPRHEP